MTMHENAGMTRAMVHEVMHDMTVVKAKKTTSRMRTSGGRTKFSESVHLGNIAAIARTSAMASSKPLKDYCVCVFKTIGFSRLWSGRGVGLDITHHVSGESIRANRQ